MLYIAETLVALIVLSYYRVTCSSTFYIAWKQLTFDIIMTTCVLVDVFHFWIWLSKKTNWKMKKNADNHKIIILCFIVYVCQYMFVCLCLFGGLCFITLTTTISKNNKTYSHGFKCIKKQTKIISKLSHTNKKWLHRHILKHRILLLD